MIKEQLPAHLTWAGPCPQGLPIQRERQRSPRGIVLQISSGTVQWSSGGGVGWE